jgi:hypothetical protein
MIVTLIINIKSPLKVALIKRIENIIHFLFYVKIKVIDYIKRNIFVKFN